MNLTYYFSFLEVCDMITIDLGSVEEYDDALNEFVYHDGGIVRFEYSLKAVYEWEGKWKKAFLKGEATDDELIDFYKHMALDPFDTRFLTNDVINALNKYISNPNTATTFATHGQDGVSGKSKIYTSEEIYANMIVAGVPLEFESRNLNRLLTTLKIISLRNEPPKKMAKQDILKQNTSLNEQRKAMLKTKG